jgi:uncharacterized protein (DUF362 family)
MGSVGRRWYPKIKEKSVRVSVDRWMGPETVEHALERVNAWDGFKKGMNVLLKPNVVMGGSPKISCRGITTSPEVVEAVIDLVREKGAGSVIIAEGSVELPSLKLDTAAAYAWSGIQALAQRKNIELVDLNKGPHRAFTLGDGTEIEIAEAVFEADFVINLPVLKTHNQTMTTVCLKNLKGCLSMETKKRCHTETDLSRAIAEFNRFIPCHLNVVDALTATEIGPTPTGKEDQVREMGLILAGKDRLSCDVVGSFLLGYDASQVPHIAHYAEMEGRSAQYKDIEIVGEDPSAFRLELEYEAAWADDMLEKFNISGIRLPPYGDKVCSACGFNVWGGLMLFSRENKGAQFDNVQLCIGESVEPSRTAGSNVLVGKCAIEKYRDTDGVIKIPGCPPDPNQFSKKLIKELCGTDAD